MKRVLLSTVAILMLTWLSSCDSLVSDNRTETGTRGKINILADHTLRKVMEQQLKVWDSTYPEGQVLCEYATQAEAFERLLTDSSIRLIITTRDITEEEKKYASSKKWQIRSLAIARDGIAIVVNNNAQEKKMTMGMLVNILKGQYPKAFQIIFDDPQSGIVQFMRDSVLQGTEFDTTRVFAAGSPQAVIDYVSKNKDALGILSIEHIYKPIQNPGLPEFIDEVSVVALQADNDTTNRYYQPYAANMALGYYPLTRNIYFVLKENWYGLGSGFVNFLTQPSGQLLFKKANMVPLRVPLEIMEVKIN